MTQTIEERINEINERCIELEAILDPWSESTKTTDEEDARMAPLVFEHEALVKEWARLMTGLKVTSGNPDEQA